MALLAAPLLIIGAIVAFYKPVPHLATPTELANWSECKLPKITEYLGQGVEYKRQESDWMNAEAVMAQKWGDCKGKALIARDTLLMCGYPTVRIVTIRRGVGKGLTRHAIVLFQMENGRRGYVDASIYRTYDPGTAWVDVVGEEQRWRDWELEEQG